MLQNYTNESGCFHVLHKNSPMGWCVSWQLKSIFPICVSGYLKTIFSIPKGITLSLLKILNTYTHYIHVHYNSCIPLTCAQPPLPFHEVSSALCSTMWKHWKNLPSSSSCMKSVKLISHQNDWWAQNVLGQKYFCCMHRKNHKWLQISLQSRYIFLIMSIYEKSAKP